MANLFCNQCGHRNPPGARFCSSCGAPLEPRVDETTVTLAPVDPGLESPDEEVTVALDEVPAQTGLLVVKRGPGAGSRFALDAPVTRVGRHPDSDIFLDDITVSRRHAEFTSSPEGVRVRDVGSLNGTYVNRERIEEATLRPGDEVQIGAFKLVFFVGAGQGGPGRS